LSESESDIIIPKAESRKVLNYASREPKRLVNDVSGLKQKFIELRDAYPVSTESWPERLDVSVSKKAVENASSNNPLDVGDGDVDDDFMRELSFVRLAQIGILDVLPRLQAIGITTHRPDDYLAEMAKSDSQMSKIRDRLAQRRADLDARQTARQFRQLRKDGKSIQQDVIKRRFEEKKLLGEAVKKFSRTKDDGADDASRLEQAVASSRQKKKESKAPNRRRVAKNKKFGFGGQKKRSKWNTFESAGGLEAPGHGEKRFRKQHGAGAGGKGKDMKHRAVKLTRQRSRNTNKSSGGRKSKR